MILFFRMSCRVCHHKIDLGSHDLCHTHAYCAKGPQYFASPCPVCHDLWSRANNLRAPAGAFVAFYELEDWIYGFRKNSRNRPKGTSFFFDPEEKEAFYSLQERIEELREIPEQVLPDSSHSVSKIYSPI